MMRDIVEISYLHPALTVADSYCQMAMSSRAVDVVKAVHCILGEDKRKENSAD